MYDPFLARASRIIATQSRTHLGVLVLMHAGVSKLTSCTVVRPPSPSALQAALAVDGPAEAAMGAAAIDNYIGPNIKGNTAGPETFQPPRIHAYYLL